MAKHLFYRMFGLRRVPQDVRRELQHEGIVFDEEGTSCALGYRDFRGPRNASHRGWEGTHAGSLVITHKTFYVQLPYLLLCRQPVGIALAHFTQEVKRASELLMVFDAEHLFDDASGELSCLWRTDKAALIHAHLERLKDEHADA